MVGLAYPVKPPQVSAKLRAKHSAENVIPSPVAYSEHVVSWDDEIRRDERRQKGGTRMMVDNLSAG